jgi:hypothetical protein
MFLAFNNHQLNPKTATHFDVIGSVQAGSDAPNKLR